jgi:penicillin-insensitive murein endopeptidase
MIRLLLTVLLLMPPLAGQASTCYGTVGHGRLANGSQLPARGQNYAAYSQVGVDLGRTYLHAQVEAVMLAAYEQLQRAAPEKLFVYGETGLATGGAIPPHRTHQAGLSVDFMVPLLDRSGKSAPIPASPLNKFGYGLEFDAAGRSGELTIDFDAMAEHLYQLEQAARKKRAGVALVIFDPALMPLLFNTARGPYLKQTLPFMKGRPWVRHDEHYHVDFTVPCRPLGAYPRAGQ